MALFYGDYYPCEMLVNVEAENLKNLKFGKIWGYMAAVSNVQLSFFTIGLLAVYLFKNYRNCPPGPWGVPFLGSLAYLSAFDVHDRLVKLSKRYGKVFGVKMGFKNLVVISDAKMMKEAFNKEEFNGRPNNEFIKLLGGYGIVNVDGYIWKEQRRFIHSCLRSFGMTIFNKKNSNNLQSRIKKEVDVLLSNLRNEGSGAIDLNQYFAVSISNVICSILMSVRFTIGDQLLQKIMLNIEEGFRLFGGISVINYFPFLRYFPMFSKGLKKIQENKQQMDQFFQQMIDEHRNTFDEHNTRDLLDYYLVEIKKAEQNGRGENFFHGLDHNTQIRQIMLDLFTAGMETTKTTLHWTMIYMLHYPDIAKMVQTELDQVVGRQRMPTFDDIPHLPITEATILEVLRKSSVVPLGVSHSTTRDVYFKGFKIPKNTEIVPLLYAVNNDPTLWNEPEQFNPNRFLDSEGKISKPEYFIPFGIGRRNCLGEMLARMEIFTFFAGIMHTFDVALPVGHSLPKLEGNLGVTLSPCSYKVILKSRALETNRSDE